MAGETTFVRWFEELKSADTAQVGGKNSSLGEMIATLKEKGIQVPDGFATTSQAYRRFLQANDLEEEIQDLFDAFHDDRTSLKETGREIRSLILAGEIPAEIAESILDAYHELGQRYGVDEVDVAVRSSATAEDLPEASFAGQQDSFLNIAGDDALLEACKRCFASLFTDRAITYREKNDFHHMEVALSVGIQKMVRSDLAGAGVAFTLDTDSGFPDVVLINAAWGLGESVVQGTVNPDQYLLFKPFLQEEALDPVLDQRCGSKEIKIVYSSQGPEHLEEVDTSREEQRQLVLSQEEIIRLARWCVAIEEHYGAPMDIEWAKDGEDEAIYIVQARPETVHSREKGATLKTYTLQERRQRLATGLAIGHGIGTGKALTIDDPGEIDRFEEGAVLITRMTDPDWVPIMKQAAAIVTEVGGRTSHAAIVSRELGIPALVGTEDARERIQAGREVTVSCVEGDQGYVYEGFLDYDEEEVSLDDVPTLQTQIMLNIASPNAAMRWWRLPCRGVGLARMEYLINNIIQVHPLALTHFDQVDDDEVRDAIEALTERFQHKETYFIDHLARGIATIAASQHPEPVIVRMSDFKTNEYADLIGGQIFEPREENPMLGWRGASRYYSQEYRPGFDLECRALLYVRDKMGFTNVAIMIPFCRPPAEADQVLEVMAENGLIPGKNGLQVYVMAELPSNIIQAEEFAQRFDGFSIGSNDLTQLTLGISRDAERLADLFDENEPSVKWLIQRLINRAHDAGRTVGFCGEAPSNDVDFAAFLVESGIDSLSLAPDSVLKVIHRVAHVEAQLQEK